MQYPARNPILVTALSLRALCQRELQFLSEITALGFAINGRNTSRAGEPEKEKETEGEGKEREGLFTACSRCAERGARDVWRLRIRR